MKIASCPSPHLTVTFLIFPPKGRLKAASNPRLGEGEVKVGRTPALEAAPKGKSIVVAGIEGIIDENRSSFDAIQVSCHLPDDKPEEMIKTLKAQGFRFKRDVCARFGIAV